ncbi:MAG: efflux RND transporter periplasmic adaptor subunit, partial [Dysgonamonadaceae bacterium]|nr:efflux RND transporter periplasmic adaptor subunit [Dysgonamonadaceae bacterium]
ISLFILLIGFIAGCKGPKNQPDATSNIDETALSAPLDTNKITLSKEVAALADIRTITISLRNPVKEIYLSGTIQPNERLCYPQKSQVNGQVKKLYIHTIGENVRKGQLIASIESADIQMDITSNAAGFVTVKRVSPGDSIKQGDILLELADLSSVWAICNVSETNLPFLKAGNKLSFSFPDLPGKTFSGTIASIDPQIDKTTRTTKIRAEIANPRLELKPGMQTKTIVHASLRKQIGGGTIVIPKTAVLRKNNRSVVYIKQPKSNLLVFQLREVELGDLQGDSYTVLSGLNEGDEVVIHGVFSIDAINK